jgi:hypothetical protein
MLYLKAASYVLVKEMPQGTPNKKEEFTTCRIGEKMIGSKKASHSSTSATTSSVLLVVLLVVLASSTSSTKRGFVTFRMH